MISAVVLSALVALIALTGNAEAIIGGHFAKENQFPYAVSLYYKGHGHLCGGAIISERHVLTASHCVDGLTEKNLYIIAGVKNIKNARFTNKYSVAQIDRHYWFKAAAPGKPPVRRQQGHDIALITVRSAFKRSKSLEMIELPKGFSQHRTNCTIAGWGRVAANGPGSDDLKYTSLELGDPTKCATRCTSELACRHNKKQLCASDPHQASSPCNGDSGGAVVCRGHLVGVTSFGSCSPALPIQVMNVDEYIEFIKSIVCRNIGRSRKVKDSICAP